MESMCTTQMRFVFGCVQALLQLIMRVQVVRRYMASEIALPHWDWIEVFIDTAHEAAAKEAEAMQKFMSKRPEGTGADQGHQDIVSLSPEVALSRSQVVVAPIQFDGQDEQEDGRHLQPPQLVARALARVRGMRNRLRLAHTPAAVPGQPEQPQQPQQPPQPPPRSDQAGPGDASGGAPGGAGGDAL